MPHSFPRSILLFAGTAARRSGITHPAHFVCSDAPLFSCLHPSPRSRPFYSPFSQPCTHPFALELVHALPISHCLSLVPQAPKFDDKEAKIVVSQSLWYRNYVDFVAWKSYFIVFVDEHLSPKKHGIKFVNTGLKKSSCFIMMLSRELFGVKN